MSPPNYHSRVVKRRKQLGVTQRQIAELLGVDERTVSHWEQGHHLPRLTPLQTAALCRVLKWTIEQLAEAFAELHTQKS